MEDASHRAFLMPTIVAFIRERAAAIEWEAGRPRRAIPEDMKHALTLSLDWAKRFGDGRLSLRGLQLRGASFRGISLAAIDLDDSDLSDCDFAGADLSGASFRSAKLTRSRFGQVNGADFSLADLTDSYFEMSWVVHVSFERARMAKAYFFKCALAQGANFHWADLTDATFYHGGAVCGPLPGMASFQWAVLDGVRSTERIFDDSGAMKVDRDWTLEPRRWT